jgi:NitT/TauT family transport system substrate-binding protein
MTTTRRDFLRTGVGLGAVAVGVARAGAAAAQAAVPVKIGHVVLGDLGINVPTMVALEKGFFKQQGLDAEMITFKSGPDLLKGVMAGGADIGLTGATDPIVFRDRGSTIRMIATVTDKNHFTLTALPAIKKLADLKGASIGVTAVGATTWVFGRMIARKMGWEPDRDVKLVGIGGVDAQAAGLKRGEIQASIFGDGGALLEAQGVGHILMRLDEVTPKWISLCAYSTDEVIKARKDVVARALRGLFQGARFFKDNADEGIRIATKGLGWPEAAVRRAYALHRPLLSTDGTIDLDAMKFMQDTLIEVGVVKQRLPLDQQYTAEFTPVKG